MQIVVITGPPGVGKSSVATSVHDAVGDAGIPNALIEVDELERAYPPLPSERVFAHVATLSRSYRAAGYGLLFVTATIEGRAYGDALMDAVAADDALVVLLTATPGTLERRIRSREPASWSGLDDLVGAAVRLAGEMPGAVWADLVLDTEDLDLAQCAQRVRAATVSSPRARTRRP